MQVFVISLKAAQDRRAFIKKQLDDLGIQFEFIDAAWGKDYYDDPEYYDREKALKIELRDLTPGEVGCAISHQKAYDKIIEQNLPYAFVMEDDAVASPDLPEALERIKDFVKDNMLITFERCDVFNKKSRVDFFKNYSLVKPKMIRLGAMSQAAGYLITRAAAEKIRNKNRPVYVPADSWGQFVNDIDFWGVRPTLTLISQNTEFDCTTQDYNRSEFTPSTPYSLIKYWFKTRTALGRFMVRTAKKILRRN